MAFLAKESASLAWALISLARLAREVISCTNTSKKSVPGDPRPGARVNRRPGGCRPVCRWAGPAPVVAGREENNKQSAYNSQHFVWSAQKRISRFDGRAEKINITLPRRLLAQIDRYAKARGETRSGFLAEAARAAMR